MSHAMDERLDSLAMVAGDLARAAAAVVCTPVALVWLREADGASVEALHGVEVASDERNDLEGARAFARLAMLQTDPLAVPDLAAARGLPPALDPGRTRLRWCGAVPLPTAEGRPGGVVCVFDRAPRSGGRGALERLAGLVRAFDPLAVADVPWRSAGDREAAFSLLTFLRSGAAAELSDLVEDLAASRRVPAARKRALELLRHLHALLEDADAGAGEAGDESERKVA
jgi:hypothetical protein